MTDVLTRIRLPKCGSGAGIMDWGVHTVADMIEQIRSAARADMEKAQLILAADDAAFQVDVVRGSAVQHHVRTLQSSIARARGEDVSS